MIRATLAFMLLLTAFTARAANFRSWQVLDVRVGLMDWEGAPTLCLTTVVDPEDGRAYGLVEDITDCYWARAAQLNPAAPLRVPTRDFLPLDEGDMHRHLQAYDPRLEFLWSTAD